MLWAAVLWACTAPGWLDSFDVYLITRQLSWWRPGRPPSGVGGRADPHAVLAMEPGPDLAVALAGERRVGQHPPDKPDQLLVADRWHRPASA